MGLRFRKSFKVAHDGVRLNVGTKSAGLSFWGSVVANYQTLEFSVQPDQMFSSVNEYIQSLTDHKFSQQKSQ
jgi:hypothetical protein